MNKFLIFTFCAALAGCSADPYKVKAVASPVPGGEAADDAESAATTGLRVRLTGDDFFSMKSTKPESYCPGDAKNYYNPFKMSGNYYSLFIKSGIDPTTTAKPAFVKNIALDVTNSNYYQTANSSNSVASNAYATDYKNTNDACSYQSNPTVPSSLCAAFDHRLISQATVTWYADPTATTLDATNTISETQLLYGTNYYRLLDQDFEITAQNPVPNPSYSFSTCKSLGGSDLSDPEYSRRGVGGINIDIDRNVLGKEENLLLHVLFIPLGPDRNDNQVGTANKSFYPNGNEFTERPVFRVQMLSIGQGVNAIKSVIQPRNLAYVNQQKYPRVVKDLAILSRPSSQVREEQIVIPLRTSIAIDRIRVERLLGSAILIEAGLYRMGSK